MLFFTWKIFDSLPKLEENVADETKMALVHAAGYVTRNDVTDDDLFEVDMKYYRKYGAFTQSIDVPSVGYCMSKDFLLVYYVKWW